ncbi:M48 family metalloprotease [Paracoccus sp. S1E-3]|uniref:M48 family metalloprotease n=1 Tax=Paracoccus sp. S1E-3 TaxID=2756130 RepID=UPI001C68B401|nr:M48 family metalloprotease [Paracoccus sp. S1E-3]
MPRSPRGPGRTHPQGRAAARARALSRAEPAAERLRPGQPRGQRIWVTDGLLGLLDGRELAGVLAHEIGHIANRDLWIMSLADMMSRLVSLASWLGQQNGDLSEGRSQVFQRRLDIKPIPSATSEQNRERRFPPISLLWWLSASSTARFCCG